MRYLASFIVEVETPEMAAEIRDRAAAYLDSQQGVELLSWSAACESANWQVSGVNTSTGKPFQQSVEADSEDEARAMFKAPKVVAAIREVP